MNKDLKIIKKKFGEKMSHLCRELFPSILETEGILSSLLLSYFEPSHTLYDDLVINSLIEKFKVFILNCTKKEDNKKEYFIIETPEELLSKVGYKLYECKSEKDIQKFKKYYTQNEMLCTFEGDRLDSCYVFFAVKKDIDDIKREDYNQPDRQDMYGTSILSIQFSKDATHTLSIKNRYNHTVNNPDATFSNNLDNIIPGLTDSFAKYYDMKQLHKRSGFEIPNYVVANDNKYYKYNEEMNNVYYCPNNIVIDNFKVKRYEKEKYIIIDNIIVDLVNKTIDDYPQFAYNEPELYNSFSKSIGKIEKIDVRKYNNGKIILVTPKDGEIIIIEIDQDNCIIGYTNYNVCKINNDFLELNTKLKKLNLPNLKIVGNNFLYNNKELTSLSLPNLEIIGDYFLYNNFLLEEINVPKLKYVGEEFLIFNEHLSNICVPELRSVGAGFLSYNNLIKEINFPNLETAGMGFFSENKLIVSVNLPKLSYADSGFLENSEILTILNLPNLEKVCSRFLCDNEKLRILNLPKLREIHNCFLANNNSLTELSLPSLRQVGEKFLCNNDKLTKLYLPNLEYVLGAGFLQYNTTLRYLELPNFKEIGNKFMYSFLQLNEALGNKILQELEEKKNNEKGKLVLKK